MAERGDLSRLMEGGLQRARVLLMPRSTRGAPLWADGLLASGLALWLLMLAVQWHAGYFCPQACHSSPSPLPFVLGDPSALSSAGPWTLCLRSSWSPAF